jgi:hypothetical protein
MGIKKNKLCKKTSETDGGKEDGETYEGNLNKKRERKKLSSLLNELSRNGRKRK